MTASVENGRNRRQHLRYRDPANTVLTFTTQGADGKKSSFVGLIVNESFKGLAVVFVGDGQFQKGDSVFWQEAPTITTPCTVIRCQRLDDDIYSLALRIEC